MKQINVGFIGAGKISEFHFLAAKSVGFNLYGICGKNNSKRAKAASNKYLFDYYFNSVSSLISSDLNFLVLLVPPQATKNIVEKVKDFNGPILIEKPVATNLKDFDYILNLMKDNRKILVGYNRRFYESVQKMKTEIENLDRIQFHVNISEAAWGSDFRLGSTQDLVISNSVHVFDLIKFLFGKVIVKSSCEIRNKKNLKASSLVIETENGHIGTINFNFGVPNNLTIECFSVGFYAKLSPLEKLSVYRKIEARVKSNTKSYIPILDYQVLAKNRFKPGFQEMYREFLGLGGEFNLSAGCSLIEARDSIKLAKVIRDASIE